MTGASLALQVKTDQATQPRWPVERKVDLVLEGLLGDRSISKLCREAGVSPASYYRWRRQLVIGAQASLAHPEAEWHALEERMQQLEAQNLDLQRQVRVLQELCVLD